MLIEVGRAPAGTWTRLQAGALVPRQVRRTDDGVVVAVLSGGALLLAGDQVSVIVRVGAGCTLEVEDVGGIVAYGGRDAVARWEVDVEVANGGRLVWHTQPFVVATGAHVRRRTNIRLDEGGVALLRETFVLGRHREAGGHLVSTTDVHVAGRPLLREQLEVDGSNPRPGVLGSGHRVLDTAQCFGEDPAPVAGALDLAGPGMVVRAMGEHAHIATVEAAWRSWTAAAISAAVTTAVGRDTSRRRP